MFIRKDKSLRKRLWIPLGMGKQGRSFCHPVSSKVRTEKGGEGKKRQWDEPGQAENVILDSA